MEMQQSKKVSVFSDKLRLSDHTVARKGLQARSCNVRALCPVRMQCYAIYILLQMQRTHNGFRNKYGGRIKNFPLQYALQNSAGARGRITQHGLVAGWEDHTPALGVLLRGLQPKKFGR